MLPTKEFINRAIEAVINLDDEEARNIAFEALERGINAEYLIEHGFHAAINLIKEMFNDGEVFLPHMIASAEAAKAGISVLIPAYENHFLTGSKGTVLLGTVEGDIHSIGKDIVATSLQIDGYNVIDLGVDVPAEIFVEETIRLHPDIIATSALMTITMINQMTLEEKLREAGIRERVKTIVGGTPVTAEWATEIGADIYAADASEVVEKVNFIMESASKNTLISADERNYHEQACYL